jgi:aconitase B
MGAKLVFIQDMNTGDVIKIYPYEGKITNVAGETMALLDFV